MPNAAKIFTRLIKEITVAAAWAAAGANPRACAWLEKPPKTTCPRDNVQRHRRQRYGQLGRVEYIELRYEGYGIGGAALMVDCLTDNKTRTVADVRHAFTKTAATGFNRRLRGVQLRASGGYLVSNLALTNALMEAALEAGAEDLITNDNSSIGESSPPRTIGRA